MIEYRYLRPEDAEAAADIHIEGQPGTVLTLLGRRFLIELYRAVAHSKWGEGVGAFNDGRLVGQAVVAVSSDKFFSEFKFRYLWRVTLPVALAVLKNPKIVTYVVNGWSYAEQVGSPEQECDVLFLGVTKAYLRNGIGPELVRYLFGWAGQVGLISANLMIEKRNRPMRWMIGQLNGLTMAHEFKAYGRKMLFYKVPIAPNLENALKPAGRITCHIYPGNNSTGKDQSAAGQE